MLYRRYETDLVDSIILVQSNETGQFAGLVLKNVVTLCRVRCFDTQVRGLFVCPFREGDEPLPRRSFKNYFSPGRVDLQTQLGYLHTTTNLATAERFALVQSDLCRAARRTLFNKLQAISGAHNIYALLDIYGPGHMVYQAGASAYVTKCVKTEVTRAEYRNCTHEIPVLHHNRTMFADPLTLILNEFPTVIPCSDIMPPRWRMGGVWYCSHPRVLPCESPSQLNLTVTTYKPLHQFTTGLGKGIYSAEQLQRHQEFQLAQMSRRPVLAKITNAATTGGHGSYLGSPISEMDIKQLSFDIAYHLFPVIYYLGEAWKYVSTFLLIALCLKILGGAIIRSFITYRRRGCGRWVVFAAWETLFIVITTPWRLMTQTAAAMTAPLEENGVNDPEHGGRPLPPSLSGHPDFAELSKEVERLKQELIDQDRYVQLQSDEPTSPFVEIAPQASASAPEDPEDVGPTQPLVNVHLPISRLFPPPEK